MTTTLSPLLPEHAEAVRSWAVGSRFSESWLGTEPGSGLALGETPSDVRRYVLLEDGVLRAYGELWIDEDEDEVELAHLLVDPAQRRRGHGAALVREMVPLARDLAGDVLLRVEDDNEAAIATYASVGFVHLGADELAVFNEGQPRAYAWMRLPRDVSR